jgi:tetratricopeptide (TPR) repeat protein
MSLRALRYGLTWPRPFERSVDRDRLRSRILAMTGLWFLLAGFLAALGFVEVAIISFGVLIVSAVVAAAVVFLGGYPLRQRLQIARRSLERAVRDLRDWAEDVGFRQRLQRHILRGRRSVAHGTHSLASLSRRLTARAGQAVGSVSFPSPSFTPKPAGIDRRSEARRLNELGAQLRRQGNHEQAAEQHLAALAIVRDLGDRRAEAMTLNNLALALVHIGGVAIAVPHFERALAVLRDLGDEEHEGQVIANLGFLHRRQGRDEEADSLLHAALDKLTPQSSAYRQVEEQLRRAS